MWELYDILLDGWTHSVQGCFCLLSASGEHMALNQNTIGGLISGKFQSLLMVLSINEGRMRQQ